MMLLPRTVVLLLAAVLLLQPVVSEHYNDYDDSHDDFWKDKPPKEQPKEKVDPQTGQRLVSTKIRFLQARLKPDKHRTTADESRLASELNEVFFQEGQSHNKAQSVGSHVITIQTRDEWDEVKDAIFSIPEIYDVNVRGEVHVRPGAEQSYSALWRAEMEDDRPEPLAANANPPPPPADAVKDGKKGKKKGKGKKKSTGKKGRSGEDSQGGQVEEL